MSNDQQSLQDLSPEPNQPNSSWRFMYLNAVRAVGIEHITKAVTAAEDAIFARWQGLNGHPGDIEERSQLNKASATLLKIKIEKLGWPDPRSTLQKRA
jgi:hypothetical protein